MNSSKVLKGHKLERCKCMSCRMIRGDTKGKKNPMYGRKQKESTKELLRAYKGKKHSQWTGGRTIHGGYVFIYSPNHPSKRKSNLVQEHRLVMEKYLGRYLEKEETIHHKNHIRTDNRIENLQLCKNNGEHIAIHNRLRKGEKRKHEKTI